ncbi:MAG: glycosyltransferase family 4 protein [Pseudomonadota bacterium]
MHVLLYCPMKPPDDPKPSGDRTIARLLERAFAVAGHNVTLVSRHRSWQRAPDASARARNLAKAADEVERIVRHFRERGPTDRNFPKAFVTYHNYYKAPDDIGPAVADALNIPYVLVEASHAPRRQNGPWHAWQSASDRAIQAARAILNFTQRDATGIARNVATDATLIDFPPFLDTSPFQQRNTVPDTNPSPTTPMRLITVAMMRAGDKRDSYRALGSALEHIADRNWHIDIIGHGAARTEITDDFAWLNDGRVNFLGARTPDEVTARMWGSDVFVWPGLGEAFGMAYLEAQASGLPVVAFETAGVPAVVRTGVTGILTPAMDTRAYADAIAVLIDDPELRKRLGEQARDHVIRAHGLPRAAAQLDTVLQEVAG